MATKLPSEVRFGSLLAYSPRGEGDESRKSQRIRAHIKAGKLETLAFAAKRTVEELEGSRLSEVLGPDVLLIPVPGSSPHVKGGLWVPARICRELVAVGLGERMALLIQRTEAVPKSAFCKPGERPTAERHFETMAVDPPDLLDRPACERKASRGSNPDNANRAWRVFLWSSRISWRHRCLYRDRRQRLQGHQPQSNKPLNTRTGSSFRT